MEIRDDLTLLVNVAQRRDRAAFAEFFSRYEKRSFSLALHLTRNRDLAQDAVQDAMLDVWIHASSHHSGHVAGWILRIVANKSITLAKRRNKEGRQMHELEAEEIMVQGPSPASLTERDEQLRVLRETLEQLPLLDRQALALRYAGGLTQTEIGEALSVSHVSISNRLAKACAQLRVQLAQAGYVAALPLVSEDGLCEAFCSGHEAPAGLRERVLERAVDAVRESLRVSATRARRALKTPTSLRVLFTTSVVVAVSAGALAFYAWRAPDSERSSVDQTSSLPVPPSKAVKEAKPEPSTDFHRHWTFEKGPPGDIEVKEGGWSWDGKEQMVVTSKATHLLLPGPVPHKPLMLRARGRIIRIEEDGNSAGAWADDARILPFRILFTAKGEVLFKQDATLTYYFIGNLNFTYLNKDLICIQECNSAASSRRLCWSIHNWSIQELELKTVSEGELPESLRDPQALIAKGGMRPVDIPEHVFAPLQK